MLVKQSQFILGIQTQRGHLLREKTFLHHKLKLSSNILQSIIWDVSPKNTKREDSIKVDETMWAKVGKKPAQFSSVQSLSRV